MREDTGELTLSPMCAFKWYEHWRPNLWCSSKLSQPNGVVNLDDATRASRLCHGTDWRSSALAFSKWRTACDMAARRHAATAHNVGTIDAMKDTLPARERTRLSGGDVSWHR